MNLSKFSCGCIGWAFEPKALVLAPCDGDRNDPYLNPHWRDLSDKTHEPLDEAKSRELLDEATNLVHDGHKFQEVRGLLR
jgi:hypothetical protein